MEEFWRWFVADWHWAIVLGATIGFIMVVVDIVYDKKIEMKELELKIEEEKRKPLP